MTPLQKLFALKPAQAEAARPDGHAWVAEEDVAQKSRDGTIKIPLASLRGRKAP